MSAADLAALAIDPNFEIWGLAASYTPPGGGSPVACLVIRKSPDQEIEVGRGFMRGDMIEVRKSEIAAPAKGGTFTLGAEVLKVLDDPRSEDACRLVWKMTVR